MLASALTMHKPHIVSAIMTCTVRAVTDRLRCSATERRVWAGSCNSARRSMDLNSHQTISQSVHAALSSSAVTHEELLMAASSRHRSQDKHALKLLKATRQAVAVSRLLRCPECARCWDGKRTAGAVCLGGKRSRELFKPPAPKKSSAGCRASCPVKAQAHLRWLCPLDTDRLPDLPNPWHSELPFVHQACLVVSRNPRRGRPAPHGHCHVTLHHRWSTSSRVS